MRKIFQFIRKNFIAGVIVSLPLFATGYISWWLINWFDGFFKPLIPLIPFKIDVPGIGIVVTLTLTVLIGAIASNFLGRGIIGFGEKILSRMPVVRNIYNALKQIVETVLTNDKANFKNVGLIEYPRKGLHAIVFIANDTAEFIKKNIPQDDHGDRQKEYSNVFLPTTPNPTSGYMLIVPKKDIVSLDISFEEAAKLVISGGIIDPQGKKKKKIKLS